ncbi:MAG: exosortase C-terminal domain/associated protein EpsI [Isosphaeraceae bacterium]
MSTRTRVILCVSLLGLGLAGASGLEAMTSIERPPLRAPLATLPMELGEWVGHDVPIDPHVLKESQADDYLNREYEDRRRPGRKLSLWINYSTRGLNLRHSPEVCLPSGGWEKVESQSRVIAVSDPSGRNVPLTRLGYAKGELVQSVGFWYYIFGEGSLEQYVRSLPVTSRSSHGRTTRGSGMTVEVFCPGTTDPDGEALKEFAKELLPPLESILPTDRANYHIP